MPRLILRPRFCLLLAVLAAGLSGAMARGQDLETVQETVPTSATSKPAAPLHVPAKAGSNWTLCRGNVFATGEAQSCLPDDLQLLWKYEVKNGAFEATPTIVDGVCYIPDLDGTLHAIDLKTGGVQWTKKTGAFAFAASAAFQGGLLYVGDIDGIFYCFDLKGEQKWKFEPEGGGVEISSSASFYKGKVLYGSQDANLYCLDALSGKLVWNVAVEDQIQCAPTVIDDRSFVAGCDGKLHIIDLVKGKETASVLIDSPTGTTPAVRGKFVYFGTEAGEFFKINWQSAEIAWRFVEKRRREIRSSAAVSEKMLVFGSRSKNVYGLDPDSGERRWKFTCKRGVDSSPVIACDRVFVAASDGRIYLLDLLTGKEVWKKETGDSFAGSPAVVDGKVIIASDNGVVYCFGKQSDPSES